MQEWYKASEAHTTGNHNPLGTEVTLQFPERNFVQTECMGTPPPHLFSWGKCQWNTVFKVAMFKCLGGSKGGTMRATIIRIRFHEGTSRLILWLTSVVQCCSFIWVQTSGKNLSRNLWPADCNLFLTTTSFFSFSFASDPQFEKNKTKQKKPPQKSCFHNVKKNNFLSRQLMSSV